MGSVEQETSMPNLLTRLARAAGYAPATKAAPVAFAFYGDARPVWMARDAAAFAREGYQRNAVAHRAVRLVAEAAAAVPLALPDADDAHPLLALLSRPNPREGGARFLEGVYGHLMVSGNAALWSKCTKTDTPSPIRRSAPAGRRVYPGDCHVICSERIGSHSCSAA